MFARSFIACTLIINIICADELDTKIDKLKQERDIQELQGSNEEVEGQRFMLGNWHQYAKEIEDVKVHKDKADELTKEIEKLEHKKLEHTQHGP